MDGVALRVLIGDLWEKCIENWNSFDKIIKHMITTFSAHTFGVKYVAICSSPVFNMAI